MLLPVVRLAMLVVIVADVDVNAARPVVDLTNESLSTRCLLFSQTCWTIYNIYCIFRG